MSTLRFIGVSWLLQFKMIMRSPFDGIGNVLYPLFFATTAFFVFQAGHGPRTLIYAALGAAVMGMWSSVSTSAGSAMQRERWWGTLELLVVAPRHFSLVLFPSTLGLATVGISSVINILIVVVLPAPFGPSRPNSSPGSTAKLIPRTASISFDRRRTVPVCVR